MDQDEDDKIEREGKTPRKKAHKDETKEERTARLRERKKSDTPSKDKKDFAQELAKIELERDWYRSECKNKDRKIQEYHGILAKYKGQLETTREELDQAQFDSDEKEVELTRMRDTIEEKEKKLTRLLQEKEEELKRAQDERSQTVKQLRQQLEAAMKKVDDNEKKINELEEMLVLKDVEISTYTQDFESERNDRERIHSKLVEAEKQKEILSNMLAEKEKELTEAKKDAKKWTKKNKELEQLETDRMKEMEEEVQVPTAQVNAYSRECEILKAQNQERHKTEIQELNEKLTNEQKSKQQLESQLNTMKQQFDSVSASKESLQKSNQQLVNELNKIKQNSASNQKLVNELTILRQQLDSLTASRESLLTAYNQEKATATSLQQQLQRMREESAKIKEESVRMKAANKVLMEKVKAHESANSPPMHPSTNKPMAMRRNDGASTRYQVSPQATSSSATGGNHEYVVQGEGAHCANRTPSEDLPQPLMTEEDLKRLFKNQQQLAHYKPPVDISEQQRIEDRERQTEDEVSKSEQETDKVLQELERARQKAPLRPPPSSGSPPRHEAIVKVEETEKLVISKLPSEPANNLQATDHSGSDLKGQLTKEIHEMAEEVRRMSKRPDTDEVIFDDEDSPLPYDPNLVCPKCGRQYHVGEIQKLKRHINEFCTGKR